MMSFAGGMKLSEEYDVRVPVEIVNAALSKLGLEDFISVRGKPSNALDTFTINEGLTNNGGRHFNLADENGNFVWDPLSRNDNHLISGENYNTISIIWR